LNGGERVENEDYETVHVPKKVIVEARGLLKKSQEEGNIEWRVCAPWEAQQIVDVAMAEFIEHLREDEED